MSDLQCAARIVVAAVDDPARPGSDLVAALRAERIAHVFALASTRGSADAVGQGLAAPTSLLAGEEAADAGLLEALDEVADRFRGETVLVVVPARLAVEAVEAAGGRDVRPSSAYLLERDADGWTVRRLEI